MPEKPPQSARLPFVPEGHEPVVLHRPDRVEELALDGADAPPESSAAAPHPSAMLAIPPFPLHLCPTCQYNLTGLTHRRCPECGNEFTLQKAIETGRGTSSRTQEDRRAIRRIQIWTIASAFTIAAGVAAPPVVGCFMPWRPQLVYSWCYSIMGVAMLAWIYWSMLIHAEPPHRIRGCAIIALAIGGGTALLLL